MPIAGITELIQNLSIPCCVASSSEAHRLKLTLSITGLFPLLEGRIFGRECVIKGKPEPDIFLYAATKMGAAPSKCLVIEDSIHVFTLHRLPAWKYGPFAEVAILPQKEEHC